MDYHIYNKLEKNIVMHRFIYVSLVGIILKQQQNDNK
jgi:hypothetical protein